MWCSRTVKGTAVQVGDGRVTAGRCPACEPLGNQPIARINEKVGGGNFEFPGIARRGDNWVCLFFSLCPVSGETLSTQGIFTLFTPS